MAGPEAAIEKHFNEGITALGGLHRKTQWIGRRNCPDRFYMLPRHHFWVEFKAPGESLRPGQADEIERMLESGCTVYVIRSMADAEARLYPLRRFYATGSGFAPIPD